MKYCYECAHVTPGEPLFCNFCGRSYDVKLCPRLHPNSRRAEVCSQCGSRELSTPQPKVGLRWKVLEWLAKVLGGTLLSLLSILVGAAIVIELLRQPAVQNGLLLLGILVLVGWWLWGRLPQWFQKLVRKSFERKRRGHER